MRFFHIEFDGRLFVEQAICGNAGGEVHQEIGLPPMARVFNLADVLQLVVDGLYDGAFAQKDFFPHAHQLVLHVAFDTRDKVYPVIPKGLKQML